MIAVTATGKFARGPASRVSHTMCTVELATSGGLVDLSASMTIGRRPKLSDLA